MVAKPRHADHVADTRAALLEAARSLFAERGYAAVGTEEIVARARVTRGALYHHFRDKADLFHAVMRTVAAELAQRLVEEQTARAERASGPPPVTKGEHARPEGDVSEPGSLLEDGTALVGGSAPGSDFARGYLRESDPGPQSGSGTPATEDMWDQLRTGVEAYLDACMDGDFQRIVLVEGPAVLGPEAWGALVKEYGLGLLIDWLQEAMDEGQIATLPVNPLASLLAALIAEASLYIARSPDPVTAREETGRTLDRVLHGLRPSVPE